MDREIELSWTLEHLESSGTKIMMRGPAVCQLCGGIN